jgi:hypothetical protein
MLMTPPKAHINLQVLFKAGFPRIKIVGDPGTQGAGIVGVQGCGFKTPQGGMLAVAEATAGFAILVHMANGIMFIKGMLSMIVAAGSLEALTILVGKIVKGVGAVPKLHMQTALIVAC